jgi:hypothetical protein
MATYKGEEVTVVNTVTVDPEVIIKHYDGTSETVKLKDVALIPEETLSLFGVEFVDSTGNYPAPVGGVDTDVWINRSGIGGLFEVWLNTAGVWAKIN